MTQQPLPETAGSEPPARAPQSDCELLGSMLTNCAACMLLCYAAVSVAIITAIAVSAAAYALIAPVVLPWVYFASKTADSQSLLIAAGVWLLYAPILLTWGLAELGWWSAARHYRVANYSSLCFMLMDKCEPMGWEPAEDYQQL